MKTKLKEVGAVAAAEPGPTGTQRRKITIITEGWGSSGYYSEAILRRDGPRIFPPGTHMYLNHPTPREEAERPERDVRDLAARIATTPVMEGKALVAEADIFPHWVPVIDALSEDIGTSIIAYGESSEGEAEGRRGPIITALTEGESVDFVTRAGRGGRVGPLIESAREHARRPQVTRVEEARNAGNWLEARIHSDFTRITDYLFGEGHLTREERIGLSSAIGEALTAFNASVEANIPGLYERDPYADPESSMQAIERKEGMADDQSARITALEKQVQELTGRVDEATRATEAERAKRERAEDALLRVGAATVVQEALKSDEVKDLPERARERAAREAMQGRLPLTDEGRLDKTTLKERALRAAREEMDYLTEATGSGMPRDLGHGEGATFREGGRSGARDTDDDMLVEAFKGLGLDESTAKIAAGGR